MVHVHTGNLAVFVGGVVVNPLFHIAAGAVNRIFAEIISLFVFTQATAAFLLFYRTQNLEKLPNAFLLAASRQRIHFRKSHLYKTGGGGEISGNTHPAHTAAVRIHIHSGDQSVLRQGSRSVHIILQVSQLVVKSRVVCHHADGIVVYLSSLCRLLKNDGFCRIRNHPVKWGRGQFFGKSVVGQADSFQKSARLLHSRAFSQNP